MPSFTAALWQMLKTCEQLALGHGVSWLRVDTHKKNKAMQGLIRRNSFQYRGNVLVDVPPPYDPRRAAYEKRLIPPSWNVKKDG